jgi:hypothetical protein
MPRVQMITVLGLCLASATAAAAPPLPGNLLQCINRGFGLQRCQLVDAQLGDALVEDDLAYEGTMVVHYDFPCTGHAVQLGVKVGDGTKTFSMGATGAVITVNGTGELRTFDPSPAVTRTLTFNTACRLTVTAATLLPSTTTIQIWTLQAQDRRRIQDLAEERFLIAQDFENLSAWNVDKLTNLRDRLEDLVAANPTNVNFRVMRDAVVSALNGQPPSATLDELREAGLDVLAVLQAELEDELARTQHLIERFARWELAIPPILVPEDGN